MHVHDIVSLHVASVAFGGEGVGRIAGAVVFVRGGITGEDLAVKITEAKKNFFRGEIVEIRAASPDRIEPRCPYFHRCGGCQYLHLAYQAQVTAKTLQVEDILKRMGGFRDVRVTACPADKPLYYRNKVKFNIDRIENRFTTGFIGINNIDLVPIASCIIADTAINAQIEAVRHDLNSLKGLIPKTVTMRKTGTGTVDYYYDEDEETKKRTVTEDIAGKRFAAPLRSFFQVNTAMVPAMTATVAAALGKVNAGTVVDSYCGAGILGIAAASSNQRLVGIDSDEDSISCARQNALKNGLTQTVFFAEKTERFIDKVLKQQPGEDTSLIIDPPREGCDKKVIDCIAKYTPEQIVYVSCNPPTLARDIKSLKDIYRIESAAFIDMFPQTKHCEVVVDLRKTKTPSTTLS